MNNVERQIASMFLGLAVGDALGVPVEFTSRESIAQRPITGMTGNGTHNQPPGTFSDDSSLSFCLAESLINGYNVMDIAERFVRWRVEGYWTAHGEKFDIGNATQDALNRIIAGMNPIEAGGSDEYSNGNGSLMRIAPLVFYVASLPEENRWNIVREVSSITHRHIRSVVACCYLVEFLTEMLQGFPPHEIYSRLQRRMPAVYNCLQVPKEEQAHFDRLVNGEIHLLDEEVIKSSGYVVHTLEASIWCLLTTDQYASAVLKAVNLGDDTDTTGAVTGALAGLYYGMGSIPESWLRTLARSEDILRLALRYAHSLQL